MSDDALDRVQAVLFAALDIDDDHERERYLDAECANDRALRDEVERLLPFDSQLEAFLDAPPALALIEAQEPTTVGPYELLDRIGAGGMGAVWSATRRDADFEQRVAVKLIKRGLDTDEVIARFKRERQVLAKLEHPGITRLIDGGVSEDGRPYLAMEYFDGVPIDRYCEEHSLGLAQRLDLFEPVLEAVAYAHRNLVVHRDLKPSNVLVGDDGSVKLLDFGIAQLLEQDDTTQLTTDGHRPLTPAYASPEQLAGEPITTTTDVYSLGVVLYELLTGGWPYGERGTSEDIECAVRDREPTRPSTRAANSTSATSTGSRTWARRLHGDLDTILLTALRKEPDRRYATVDDFARDLRAHRAGHPVSARPDTWSYRTAKFIGRHRTGVIASLLVVIALTTGLVVSLVLLDQVRTAQHESDRRLDSLQTVARRLVYDIDEAIGQLDPESPARTVLERTAERQLQALAMDAVDNPELRREVIAAYFRLAEVLDYHFLRTEVVELRERAESMRVQALDLFESAPLPDDIRTLQMAVAGRYRLGLDKLASGALEDAESHLSSALRDHPYSSDPGSAKSFGHPTAGQIMHAFARLEKARGDSQSEALALEEAYQTLTDPPEPVTAAELGSAFTKLGRSVADQGNKDEGVVLLERSVGLLSAALDQHDNPRWRDDLAYAYLQLAGVTGELGDGEKAATLIAAAREQHAKIASSLPEEARGKHRIAYSLRLEGDAAMARNDVTLALESYQNAARAAQEIVDSHPHFYGGLEELARSTDLIGKCLSLQGDHQQALDHYRQALTHCEQLVAKATDEAEARRDLAVCCYYIGLAEKAMAPKSDTATEHWRAALAAFERSEAIMVDLRDRALIAGKDASVIDLLRREAQECREALP